MQVNLDKLINDIPVGSLTDGMWITKGGMPLYKENDIDYEVKDNPNPQTIELDDDQYLELTESYFRNMATPDPREPLNKMLKLMSINEALDRFKEMPEFYELILDLYEDDCDEVEMGIEDGKMVCRGVYKNPTASHSHVPSTSWGDEKPIVYKTVDAEKRYTFAPWYIPDVLDAHGEWTDKEEVQQAFWKYLARNDRDIRLQHNMDIVAGKWVEGATWPYPVSLPIKHPEGDKEYTFPAGTPFLGVVWEPWAWEMIKKGEIRGLSIGGTGRRAEGAVEESAKDYAGSVGFAAKMIHRVHGKYVVFDDEMTQAFGTYDTMDEAEERLEQIERFSETEKAKDVERGDFVRWNSGTGVAQGKVTRVVRDGEIDVPDSSFTITGEEDDPALLIRIYQEGKDGWKATDTQVGHKASTVRSIQPLEKQESFTPPKGVQQEAQRALDWMAEGEAGANFTDVGRRRASQLANGQKVSLETMGRMNSFLARHEQSSKGGKGFDRGEEGYPSAGRVSWAAWGGDAGKSWVEDVLSGQTKTNRKRMR